MKKLVLILLLFPIVLFAQEKYRVDKKKLTGNKILEMSVNSIETILKKNEEILSDSNFIKNSKPLLNPLSYINELQRFPEICMQCYKNEYKDQLDRYNDKYRQLKLNLDKNEETVSAKKFYRDFAFHLNTTAPYENKFITPFIGVDMIFAIERFVSYVIRNTDYTIVSVDDSVNGKLTYNFEESISINERKNYFDVICSYKEDKNIPPYSSEMDVALILTKVEMEGTPDAILKIFINYWQSTMKLGAFNKGELANYMLMGDYISLIALSKSLYRIDIKKNPSIEMDYYELF